MNKKLRVSVGMSGGVDSSVSAYLLKEAGYRVEGVYIEAWNEPGCRTDEDRRDALKVANKLGIPFRVVDVRDKYKERVVEYFYKEYKRGRTPNPDVVCNREIKFGIFYEWAMRQGYDKIATGHYARIGRSGLLMRGRDESKDQSYFLWQVSSEVLHNVIFPLGEMKKDKVRELASEIELHVKDKPDSMGVCFIGDVDVHELIEKRLGKKKGEVVYGDSVVGEHEGVWFFTVGQRGGFKVDKKKLNSMGIDASSMGALYVIDKDAKSNRIFVGSKEQVYSGKLKLEDYRGYMGNSEIEKLAGRDSLYLRVRNLGELVKINRLEFGEEKVEVELDKKIFGIASGQSGVLYRNLGKVGDEEVVGGGIIG